MRRKRPRAEAVHPLPDLGRVSRERWLAEVNAWADRHEKYGDRWAEAHALLDEIEAFRLDVSDANERLWQLRHAWEVTPP